MSREWKPGDLARTVAGGTIARTARHRWILLDDGHPIDWDDDSRIARPLVVIDPEDREQVERMCEMYAVERNKGDRYLVAGGVPDAMQAALREFADPKPPRPEEPTGLGAVVEDAEGRQWVRVAAAHANVGRCWAEGTASVGDCAYDSIAAVKVLSEGVQP